MLRPALGILWASVRCFLAYAPVILGLGLLSSVGRVIQTGWVAQYAPIAYVLLEIVVQGARIAIFVALVGDGSLSAGIRRLRCGQFVPDDDRDTVWDRVAANTRTHGRTLVGAVLVYAAVALLANAMVTWVAERQAVIALVRAPGVAALDDTALAEIVVFFLKNVTIIPFTIVWMYHGIFGFLRQRLS